MNTVNAYLWAIAIMVVVMILPSNTMGTVNSSWYKCIRPSITPPNYVFPVVWTILYILIGIALAQTLLLGDSWQRNILLCLYAFNLATNVLWSFAYFGNRDVVLALVILLFIIVSAIFILLYTYYLLPLWVFIILLPYMCWICFAALLNALSIGKNC